MRDIKFRGMDLYGKWHFGGYMYSSYLKKHFIMEEIDNCMVEIEVLEKTIGQCTGIKDSKKRYIYEGDIISDDPLLRYTGIIGEIVFGSFESPRADVDFIGFYPKSSNDDDETTLWLNWNFTQDIVTVIGNVHENLGSLKEIDVHSMSKVSWPPL